MKKKKIRSIILKFLLKNWKKYKRSMK